MSNVPQTALGFLWPHMAKEVICHHEILTSQMVRQIWIVGVADLPVNTISDPGFDLETFTLLIKNASYLSIAKSFEDWRMYKLVCVRRVDSSFGHVDNGGRNVGGSYYQTEIRPDRSDHPQNRIHFGAIAAGQNQDSYRGVLRSLSHKGADHLELRAISKEERAMELSTRRAKLDQGMQKRAVGRDGASLL